MNAHIQLDLPYSLLSINVQLLLTILNINIIIMVRFVIKLDIYHCTACLFCQIIFCQFIAYFAVLWPAQLCMSFHLLMFDTNNRCLPGSHRRPCKKKFLFFLIISCCHKHQYRSECLFLYSEVSVVRLVLHINAIFWLFLVLGNYQEVITFLRWMFATRRFNTRVAVQLILLATTLLADI